MTSFVVHYQEIALKGKNRPWFLKRLVRNLRRAVADLDVKEVKTVMGRIEVVLGPTVDPAAVGERIRTVFGIANYSYAGRAPQDLDAIAAAILQDLGDRTCTSFRVSAKRADKRFPMLSPEIEREIGGRIHEARGWKVDLTHPELTIHVQMLTHDAFYYFGKERGSGGLPTGTAGRVTCLLSGGIDSPVAAWRMMKRGCDVTFVHFHSYPILSRASQEKARQLVELLTRYQQKSRLYLVPFGDIQQQALLTVPGPMRIVVYRRLMLRIAERIARSRRAQALITGAAVGQVASQTLENLAVVGSVATLPLFRPLIGMDKEEIMDEARRLGTYPISIIPDQDCCTLFTPRNPQTKAKLHEIERAEALLPIDDLVAKAVAEAEVAEFEFPMVTRKAKPHATEPESAAEPCAEPRCAAAGFVLNSGQICKSSGGNRQMNLSFMLEQRAAAGKPVRIGQIGAGKFGTMFLAQCRVTTGMHMVGLADLLPERARERLEGVQWPKEQVDAKSLGEAIKTRAQRGVFRLQLLVQALNRCQRHAVLDVLFDLFRRESYSKHRAAWQFLCESPAHGEQAQSVFKRKHTG